MDNNIYIEGVIGTFEDAMSDWTQRYVTYDDVKFQLENSTGRNLTVFMDSRGGNVYEGYRIYNLLKESNKNITVKIQSFAGSIATFIAMSATKVIMSEFSRFAIHNPYAVIQGDAARLETVAEELRKIEDELVSAYIKKTNKTEDEIRELMKKDTELTAKEAKEWGFVDEVIEEVPIVAYFKFNQLNETMDINAMSPEQKTVLNSALDKLKTWLTPKEVKNESPEETETEKALKAQVAELEAKLAEKETAVEEAVNAKSEIETAKTELEGRFNTLNTEVMNLKNTLTSTFGEALNMAPESQEINKGRDKSEDKFGSAFKTKYQTRLK